MADIIRDVIIKIAIKQDEVRLKAPDLGPILLPIRELQEEVKTGLPDSFEEFEKDAVKSVKEIGDEVQELTKGIEGIKPALEDTSKASEESRQKLTDDTRKMRDGFLAAGEGAFQLGRGLAFVGLASEKDLLKAVQTIAQIQGAFDILKGSIGVIKGLREGTRALQLVTTSAAVAETGLAAANTAVATTGAAAAVSMGALAVTLAPIAIAVAAVGVAFLFFRDAPDDIEETTEALEGTRKKLQQISDIKLGKIDLQLEFGGLTTEERIDALRNKLKEETAKITRDSVAGIKKADADISAAREALEKKAANRDLGVFSPAGRQALEAEDARLRANLAEAEATRSLLIQQQEEAVLGKKLKLNREITAVRESQREGIQSSFDLAQQELQVSNKLLQSAKDRVAFEKGALQTAKERFGALSAIDQLETKRAIAQFKKGGAASLGKEQAALIAGVFRDAGGKIQSEVLSRIAEERGFVGLPGKIGESNKLIQAQQDALTLEDKFGGNDGVIEGIQGTLKTIDNNMTIFLELFQQTKLKQAELETTLDKLNN